MDDRLLELCLADVTEPNTNSCLSSSWRPAPASFIGLTTPVPYVMIAKMPKATNKPKTWEQNLRAIWFAELVAIVGFYVVVPILPLYVKHLGVESERQTRI
jgi:hypothetical protein